MSEAATGLHDWSYAHCLAYFRKSETSDRGAGLYHGTDGPLRVSQGKLQSPVFNQYAAVQPSPISTPLETVQT